MEIIDEKLNDGRRPRHGRGGAQVAILLIVAGSLLLCAKLGLIPSDYAHVIISWPTLLIFFGFVSLFKRNFYGAAVLLSIGTFFILPHILRIEGYSVDNFKDLYWPILLIIGGILFLLHWIFPSSHTCRDNKWYNKQGRKHHHYRQHYRNYSTWSANTEGFSKNSVFGSGDHIVLDSEFKGGELNAVFGGLSLDLRRTNLPEGETRLDVNAVFGGITIFIPSDWFVETHLDAVFGGFQDNRIPKEPLDKTRKLIITGSCVFGGGEIRN